MSSTGCGRETGDYKTIINSVYLGKYRAWINRFYNRPFLCRTCSFGEGTRNWERQREREGQ